MKNLIKQYAQKLDQYCHREDTILRFKYSCIGTVFFCMAAHAFAYFNLMPAHDALNHTFDLAGNWEISLGRFLLPIYESIRGTYITPWLTGMLMILFYSLVSFLVSDILEIKNKWFIFLSAGFLVVNVHTITLTASFPYCLDNYALSLLLICLGVFLIKYLPTKICLPLAVLSFALSMGIYQGYILVAVSLFIIQGVFAASREGKDLLKLHGKKWVIYISSLFFSALLYLVIFNLALKFYGISAASSNNSISALSSLSFLEIPERITRAYKNFILHFFVFWRDGFSFTKFINAGWFILALILFGRSIVIRNLPLFNMLIILLGILLYPIITQAMGILEGTSYLKFLTAYAMYMMYPAVFSLIHQTSFDHHKSILKVTYLLCGFLLFNGIVFSNEIYSFQKIQYDKTLLHVTRIMDDIDKTEGYSAGETRVIMIGSFNASRSSSQIRNRHEHAGYSLIRGLGKAGITYAKTMRSFIQNMGEQINMSVDTNEIYRYAALPEIKNMPIYPSPGYCRMYDGVLIIKVSGAD